MSEERKKGRKKRRKGGRNKTNKHFSPVLRYRYQITGDGNESLNYNSGSIICVHIFMAYTEN